MLKGVDISNWQAGTTPSRLDIDFCIVKATEGTGFVDSYCDGFIQDCIKHDILWGFYHFAGTGKAREEATFFIDNTRGYSRKGIPVLDYEVWGQNADDVKWCEEFITRYHDITGVWPVLYISASRCADFNGSWIPQKCGLWVAGYPYPYTTWPNIDMPYDISPWQICAIWQFTSSLFNAYDGDFAYMDKAAWMLYAGAKQATQEKQETAQTGIKSGKVTITLDNGQKLTGTVK